MDIAFLFQIDIWGSASKLTSSIARLYKLPNGLMIEEQQKKAWNISLILSNSNRRHNCRSNHTRSRAATLQEVVAG